MAKPDCIVIDVHQGSTSETWLEVYADGRIREHTENDGWRFVNRGAETRERWLTLDDVRRMGTRHSYPAPPGGHRSFIELVEEAQEKLR